MNFGPRYRGISPVSQWLRSSGAVPSLVRQGTITVGNGSATGTDNFAAAVDVNQSLLLPLGASLSGTTTPDKGYARLSMDANGATATRNTADTVVMTVGYLLLVFPAGTFSTVQRGTVDLSAATPNTAALSPAIDTSKPHLILSLGFSSAQATSADAVQAQQPRINITAGGASVTGTTGSVATMAAFQVAQWA